MRQLQSASIEYRDQLCQPKHNKPSRHAVRIGVNSESKETVIWPLVWLVIVVGARTANNSLGFEGKPSTG